MCVSCLHVKWVTNREPAASPPTLVSARPQVFVITHENARMSDMDDYFARKFRNLQALFVIGRSYLAEPQCLPKETLYDAWKEPVPPQCQSGSHPHTCCVPHSSLIIFQSMHRRAPTEGPGLLVLFDPASVCAHTATGTGTLQSC